MWCVTTQGFFSFVTDDKDPDYLWLRARLREDLERNFPDAEVIMMPGADYLFRAKVLRTDVAKRMSEMVMESNVTSHFKDVAIRTSAVPKHGSRSAAYYALWTALAKMQPYAPYSTTPRAPEPKFSGYGKGYPAKSVTTSNRYGFGARDLLNLSQDERESLRRADDAWWDAQAPVDDEPWPLPTRRVEDDDVFTDLDAEPDIPLTKAQRKAARKRNGKRFFSNRLPRR